MSTSSNATPPPGATPPRGGKPSTWASILASRRMAITAALGFASGLPFLLTGQVLTLWLTDSGANFKTIGLFASVGLPYTFKFAWAPLLDRFVPPFLGRRRGWMLITQLGLVTAVVAMAIADPAEDTRLVAWLAVTIAALSATQDVAIDAWRSDILLPEERTAGSAAYVLGYRVAMLVVGTAGLILADLAGYQALFLGTAALLALSVVATLLAEEPERSTTRPVGLSLQLSVPRWVPSALRAAARFIEPVLVLPFAEFFRRLGWAALTALAFAALYKFGDQMVDYWLTVFWRSELGLSKTEIGTLNKFTGFAGLAVGGVVAGVLAPRLGTRRALVVFGLLQASTNFLYVVLAMTGNFHNLFYVAEAPFVLNLFDVADAPRVVVDAGAELILQRVLVGSAIFVDSVANTMGTAVFTAVFIALCNREVSATQFALLTSLSSVGKRVFGGTGAYLIDVDWEFFFGATAVMAIPGLILVYFLPRSVIERPKIAAPPAD